MAEGIDVALGKDVDRGGAFWCWGVDWANSVDAGSFHKENPRRGGRCLALRAGWWWVTACVATLRGIRALSDPCAANRAQPIGVCRGRYPLRLPAGVCKVRNGG